MPLMKKTCYGIFNLNTRMLKSADGWTLHPFHALSFETRELAERIAEQARKESHAHGHLLAVVDMTVSVK